MEQALEGTANTDMATAAEEDPVASTSQGSGALQVASTSQGSGALTEAATGGTVGPQKEKAVTVIPKDKRQKQNNKDEKSKNKNQNELKPPLRLRSKKDLFMCLALHMESSPMCEEGNDFRKTGIVVCESDKAHRVMAMCCSTKNLHAVQQAMLKTSIALRKSTIYLSRKPCSTCTKSLIQGEVSAVYYWPRRPEKEAKDDLHIVDDLFLRSSTVSSVFVPLEHLKKDTVLKLAEKARKYKVEECTSNYEEIEETNYELITDLLNLPGSKDICKRKMEHALQHLTVLLNFFNGKFEDPSVRKEHIHALQLCYLLATRSDDPDKGVGCVLYDGKGFFFGAGYNGYPIDVLYGNLPRNGRGIRSDPAKKSSLVHAEANALLFRCKKDTEHNDILYCSKVSCDDCLKYIELVGIKQIVAVEEKNVPPRHKEFTVVKRDFENKRWLPLSKPIALEDGATDQENNSDEPKADMGGKKDFRLEKRDMCIFSAIHMEKSPFCKKPQGTVGPGSKTFEFNKTGIVICEGDTFQRIIAMDCSSESLHAVQRVLLKLHNKVRGCNVFLSRIPCIDCVKFLVQAQVRSILSWPISEIEINTSIKQSQYINASIKESVTFSNKILKESCTYDAMSVPLVEEIETTTDLKIDSIFDEENPELLKILGVSFIKEELQKAIKEEVEKASKYYHKLIDNNARKLWEDNFVELKECEEKEYIQHALQLCYILADRSDVCNKVGTVIYKGENIVAVGYNGYPRGTMNNLCVGKDEDRIVCAEANALIFRPEDDLRGAELITSEKPCCGCRHLMQEKGIKRVIYPENLVLASVKQL